MRTSLENRLRKVVLHAADVLPDAVSAYLKQLSATARNHEAKEQVLKEYQPVVDFLPSEFTDFALQALIQKRTQDIDEWNHSLSLDATELGLEDNLQFTPPSSLQGPFLHLLRKSEDDGLRLVHGITSTAVRHWIDIHRRGDIWRQPLTALPTILEMPGGQKEFWGDKTVYCWFRSNANGPNMAVSALMALEVWMEQQVTSGRDSGELINKVLSGSDCVAVLGICLGLAHDRPDSNATKAVLPLLASPKVWYMDIHRMTLDARGSVRFDPLGQHKWLHDFEEQRDKLPKRRVDVRSLAIHLALRRAPGLWDPFCAAVMGFSDRPPLFWAEHCQDQRVVERFTRVAREYQQYADLEKYRFADVDDGVQVWVDPPEASDERRKQELEEINQIHGWHSLSLWASKSLEEGEHSSGLSIAEAVSHAQTCSTDFRDEGPARVHDQVRMEAIAGVAAVAIRLSLEWAQENEHLDWCRRLLVGVAEWECRKPRRFDRHTRHSSEPGISAAIGLGYLVESGIALPHERECLLRLVASSQLQVSATVLSSLRNCWAVDRTLCENSFQLAVGIGLVPRKHLPMDYHEQHQMAEAERIAKLVNNHLRLLQKGECANRPRISRGKDCEVLTDVISVALASLPLGVLLSTHNSKAETLKLLDQALAFTVEANKPKKGKIYDDYEWSRYYGWNNFILDWAAEAAIWLSGAEVEEHVFAPTREALMDSPQLTASLLYGFIKRHLSSMTTPSAASITEWRQICVWALEGVHRVGRRRHSRGYEDIRSLIVFTRYGRCLLRDDWPHAHLFLDIFDRWVETWGTDEDAYVQLLSMLDGPGRFLPVEKVVNWVYQITTGLQEATAFWAAHDNGERTATLLKRLFDQGPQSFRGDAPMRRPFSMVVDRLVSVGIPLSSILQQDLERRDRSGP